MLPVTRFLSLSLLLAAPAALLAADAGENWTRHCARCHAPDGSGQTRIGQRLKLKDYRDAAVQAEWTDEEMLQAIVEGVTDAGGRETMPGYADKLTADESSELVAYIRAMAK